MAAESELFSIVEKDTFETGWQNSGDGIWMPRNIYAIPSKCILLYLRLCAYHCVVFRRAVQRRQRLQDVEGNESNLAVAVPTLPPAL